MYILITNYIAHIQSFFYKKLDSQRISIAAGMLKNPTKLKTHSNIFTKGKMDYYKLDPKLPKFYKYTKKL